MQIHVTLYCMQLYNRCRQIYRQTDKQTDSLPSVLTVLVGGIRLTYWTGSLFLLHTLSKLKWLDVYVQLKYILTVSKNHSINYWLGHIPLTNHSQLLVSHVGLLVKAMQATLNIQEGRERDTQRQSESERKEISGNY